MSGLNVVALISGGKDSLFSLLHCEKNGHRIVALANLHPPEHGSDGRADDLESYMYQTVGHAVIPQYETALGLPLYRQEIHGSAVNQSKSYGPDDNESGQDETEDLLPLLQHVKRMHPEVNAVSTGAIMSDYQRTRVESVALRLGLVPLSYLWQWPFLADQTPESLLRHMAAVGQDARIVKVASGGLDESFLWQDVAAQRTIHRLSLAAQKFGSPDDGAVLGEGGEYETLAVSGPPPLWKGRIVVDPDSIQVVAGEAGSASVRIHTASVELHQQESSPNINLPTPPLFDTIFREMLDQVLSSSPDETVHGTRNEPWMHATTAPSQSRDAAAQVQRIGDAFLIPALVGTGPDAISQARSIMEEVKARLVQISLQPRDIVYTTIILHDMSEFAAVNAVYGSYFTDPDPPARLTVACAEVLPPGKLVTISMTIAPGLRDGLHVQSRSYWAPANIGPYSQAISFSDKTGSDATRSAVFISGQIPLVPASMEMPLLSKFESPAVATFAEQAVLALQHLHRIGRRTNVVAWTYALAFVAAPVTGDLGQKAALIRDIWQKLNAPSLATADADDVESEDFDVWHLQHGNTSTSGYAFLRGRDEESAGKHGDQHGRVPPLHIAVVDSLPRGAAVEWIGYGSRARDAFSTDEPLHLRDVLRLFGGCSARLYAIECN